ncbi:MAG: hypothetical protein ABIQ17_04545, partial [Candidatus Limnocylindrales bacterium]
MRRPKVLRGSALGLACLVLAGCSTILQASPEPTPMDFPGMAGELAGQGLSLGNFTSGDAGCNDPTLIPMAIGFDAAGLGVTTPVRLRVYIFRTGDTFDRRRPDVDPCVAQWAKDPAT